MQKKKNIWKGVHQAGRGRGEVKGLLPSPVVVKMFLLMNTCYFCNEKKLKVVLIRGNKTRSDQASSGLP